MIQPHGYTTTVVEAAYSSAIRTKLADHKLPPLPSPAQSVPRTHPSSCLIDSMASLFVLDSVDKLFKITSYRPNVQVDTIGGLVPVTAVGIALIWIQVFDADLPNAVGLWMPFYVPNVLVCERNPHRTLLWSTRVMQDLYNFEHSFLHKAIYLRGLSGRKFCKFSDDGIRYTMDVRFSPPSPHHPAANATLPLLETVPGFDWPDIGAPARGGLSPLPISSSVSAMASNITSGTPQMLLWQRLGFPYMQSWRYVQTMLDDTGLPPNSILNTSMVAHDSVMRTRARVFPFFAHSIEDKSLPPPGAVIHMDGAGLMLPSLGHGYRCYMGAICKSSNYRRLFPGHTLTAELATRSLELYLADLSMVMGLSHMLKPHVVVTDQGSCFMASHFTEFLAAMQSRHRPSTTYTPVQNAPIERIWGPTFGYARTLLAAANLPPTVHPYAVQTATWILNRLPQPSRGNCSAIFILSRARASVRFLRAFGCLVRITLPEQTRVGDRHFADRGAAGLYFGPSEVSPSAVVRLFDGKVVNTAQLIAYEDQFPGLAGARFNWVQPSDVTEPTPDRALHSTEPTAGPGGGAPPAPPSPAHYDTHGYADNYSPFRPLSQARTPGASPGQPSSPVPHSPLLPRRPASTHGGPGVGQQNFAPAPIPFPVPAADGMAPTQSPVVRESTSRIVDSQPQPVQQQLNNPRQLQQLDRTGSQWRAFAIPPDINAPRASRSQAKSAHAALAMMTLFSLPDQEHQNETPFAFSSSIYQVDDDLEPSDNVYVAAAAPRSHESVTVNDLGDVDIPKSAYSALRSPFAAYWLEAILKEYRGLEALRTWTPVLRSSLPALANIMRCHLIFTVKRLADGALDKFKARLVADGNTQKYGIDFERIFSTVVKTTTIRLVLILAVYMAWHLSSVDISQAYLQAC